MLSINLSRLGIMRKVVNTLLVTLSSMFLAVSLSASHHGADEKKPIEVVEAAYATFASGDTDAWAVLHTDDLRFTVFGQLPQSGVFVGTQSVIEGVFAKIPVLWPGFTLTPINTDVVGDTVYVHNRMEAEGLDSETMHMFVIEDGKIKSFTAFEDTDSMRQAMKGQ